LEGGRHNDTGTDTDSSTHPHCDRCRRPWCVHRRSSDRARHTRAWRERWHRGRDANAHAAVAQPLQLVSGATERGEGAGVALSLRLPQPLHRREARLRCRDPPLTARDEGTTAAEATVAVHALDMCAALLKTAAHRGQFRLTLRAPTATSVDGRRRRARCRRGDRGRRSDRCGSRGWRGCRC
jgi:hypothetical protein